MSTEAPSAAAVVTIGHSARENFVCLGDCDEGLVIVNDPTFGAVYARCPVCRDTRGANAKGEP